jgi:hypothetical protein
MKEEHPDVKRLSDKLHSNWEKRSIDELRESIKKERDVDEDIPPNIFYCSKCEEDYYPRRVYKREVQDWNTKGIFRYWTSNHCDTWNTRLITDKVKDKFFINSPSVQRERRLRKLDMLQPGETGFNMLYGNK